MGPERRQFRESVFLCYLYDSPFSLFAPLLLRHLIVILSQNEFYTDALFPNAQNFHNVLYFMSYTQTHMIVRFLGILYPVAEEEYSETRMALFWFIGFSSVCRFCALEDSEHFVL